MNFFGIGTLELLLIFLIGLLIIGPVGMIQVAQKVGAFIRQLRSSELWQVVQGSKTTLRKMENQLMSETGLDTVRKDLPSLDFTKPLSTAGNGAAKLETPAVKVAEEPQK